jgi:hypothetical protein
LFCFVLFYLGVDGTHRLNQGHTAVGLTEIIIAVAVGLFIYIAEFQPQMLGRRGQQDDG